MGEILVIDGYNIINAWPDYFDLEKISMEDARKKLLDILSDYQGYSGHKIIVVFDAHMVKDGKGSLDLHDNINVVFTKENQTADSLIERFVAGYGRRRTIRVATADYLEQKTVLDKGGLRMTPDELKYDIGTMRRKRHSHERKPTQRDFLESRLTGEQKSIFESLRRMRTKD